MIFSPPDPPQSDNAGPAAGVSVVSDRSGSVPGKPGVPLRVRLVLLALSGGGMAAAVILWIAGYPAIAARLLAGDVLLIFVILVAM